MGFLNFISHSSPWSGGNPNQGNASKGIVPAGNGYSDKNLTGSQFGSSGSGGKYDVVHEYAWTLSKTKDRDDIPYIVLTEESANESELMKQVKNFAEGNTNRVGDVFNASNPDDDMSVYNELWPERPTGNEYTLPYFAKTTFDLSTDSWREIDKTGEALGNLGNSMKDAADKFTNGNYSKSKFARGLGIAAAAGGLANAGLDLALKGRYPVLNSVDRPAIFAAHSKRSLTISFPLYNTVGPNDWIKNRDFYYQFASVNLFYKKDLIAGVPPVYYRVLVPGQYYCHAACVTNLTIENLGNTRLVDNSYIIPDAYQFNITLQEMTMPSINQFRMASKSSGGGKVTTN
jgi:hypothetical protein